MPTIPEQRLWQCVLLAIQADLRSPNTSPENFQNQEFARRWVGRYPSRDFQMVCEMAGLEIEPTHRYFRLLCEDGQMQILPRSEQAIAPRSIPISEQILPSSQTQ